MTRSALSAALAALALVACGPDRPDPVATGPTAASALAWSVTPETRALEPGARQLAIALGDATFRARFLALLRASRWPEGKLPFQRTLRANGRAELREMARLNREEEAQADSILSALPPLEVYLPVPDHRQAWQGDDRLLVATAARDGDLPVAYDLSGGRHYLDPTRPPNTPVIAVVPVETDFDTPLAAATCTDACDATGVSGGGGTSVVIAPGLYMTKAHFVQDFEGWLKGSPEFEVHVMGQSGTTDSLARYQCAGEHRSGSYYWNGGTDWSGSVMLFSQTELNAYHTAHPGQAFRLVAMEDDDTSCEMKVDQDRWKRFVTSVGTLYRDVTGATDTGSVTRYVAALKSLQSFLSALASWIKSDDDLIGNAIEDKVVGEFHTGYNWILRADENVTNGWVMLQMK